MFTPEYDPSWFEMFEGSFLVPNSVMPVMGGDADAAVRNVTEMFGMFGYGQMTLNPVTVEQFFGDTFFPALKLPATVYQADVA